MQPDHQGIMPPSSLDGATGAQDPFMTAREAQFQETLPGDETDGQNEKSGVHPQSPTGAR
jgi:hypothetical protein